jgi:excisionase family DNA binding protein
MSREQTLLDAPHRQLLVRIPVAARMISVSRAKAYAMAASGQLPGVIRLGGSVRVSVDALRDWIQQQVGTLPVPT